MATTPDLFAALVNEQQLLLDTLAPCSDELLNQKGLIGEWSIKNVLAHLTAWELVVVQTLPERLATGKRPAIFATINADEDAWNAEQVAQREDIPPRLQIFELENTRAQLVNDLRALGDDALARQHPWPGWTGTLAEYVLAAVCDHEKEHCDTICAVLAQLPSTAT
jgi:hypothetical protein